MKGRGLSARSVEFEVPVRCKWRCLIEYMTLELRGKVRTPDNKMDSIRIQMAIDAVEQDEIVRICCEDSVGLGATESSDRKWLGRRGRVGKGDLQRKARAGWKRSNSWHGSGRQESVSRRVGFRPSKPF